MAGGKKQAVGQPPPLKAAGRPYKGAYARRRRRRVIPVVITVLVLTVLFLGAFFIIQDYMVFTPDGVKLDFWNNEKKSAAGTSYVAGTAYNRPAVDIEAGELPPAGAGDIEAEYLDAANLAGEETEARVERLADSGVSRVVMDFKTADGRLTYPSQLEQAGSLPSSDTRVPDAVDKCHEAGIKIIAKIACFKDDGAPRADSGMAVVGENGVFQDDESCAWLDPYKKQSRDYLLGVCSEALDMGADELMLDWVCFPYSGDTGGISYENGGETKSQALESFLAEVKQMAGRARIGVVIGPETAGEGGSEKRGEDLSVFTDYADRLWYYAADTSEALAAYKTVQNLSSDSAARFCAVIGDKYISAGLMMPNGG